MSTLRHSSPVGSTVLGQCHKLVCAFSRDELRLQLVPAGGVGEANPQVAQVGPVPAHLQYRVNISETEIQSASKTTAAVSTTAVLVRHVKTWEDSLSIIPAED